jgi:hypothetical protein
MKIDYMKLVTYIIVISSTIIISFSIASYLYTESWLNILNISVSASTVFLVRSTYIRWKIKRSEWEKEK